jgi:hypothetical protein
MLMASMDRLTTVTEQRVQGLATQINTLDGGLETRVEAAVRRCVEDGAIEASQVTTRNLASTLVDCMREAGVQDLVQGLRNGTFAPPPAAASAAAAAGAEDPEADARHLTPPAIADDWELPPFGVLPGWLAWAVGTGERGGPYRLISTVPQSQKAKWKKFKSLMAIIESHVKSHLRSTQGDEEGEEGEAAVTIDWSTLTHARAQELYTAVHDSINTESKRAGKRRHDQLKWNTVLKNYETMRAKRKRASAAGAQQQEQGEEG